MLSKGSWESCASDTAAGSGCDDASSTRQRQASSRDLPSEIVSDMHPAEQEGDGCLEHEYRCGGGMGLKEVGSASQNPSAPKLNAICR